MATCTNDGTRHRDATGAIPTRTAVTEAHYRKEGERLVRQACGGAAPIDLQTIMTASGYLAAAHGRWKASTIRTKRAGLRMLATDLVEAGGMTARDIAALERSLSEPPRPAPSGAPPRTSARKRKTLTRCDWLRLVSLLRKGRTTTHELLAGMVALSAIVPIRPCEWAEASVEGVSLEIVCAKHTNARGLATRRAIELDEKAARAAGVVARVFRVMLRNAGSWRRLHARLAKALTRACAEASIAPVCLYTLRHQAIATAKKHFPAVVVAALAGHASVLTATRAYAKRRGGWSTKPAISVRPSLVARVRTHGGMHYSPSCAPTP